VSRIVAPSPTGVNERSAASATQGGRSACSPSWAAQGQQAHCNLTPFPHWVRRRAAETDGAYHPAMAMEPSPVLVAIREDLARLEAAAAASPPLDERVVAYTGGTPPHPWTVYVADVICADLERCGLFPRS
jgi:hypothetical protein